MKNDDSNQSVYTRREIIKKAGLTGLALAGLGGLSGCALLPNVDMDLQIAGRDFKKYDFDAIAREYETGRRPILPINSIDDFALSGEELGWMRLAESTEKKIIPLFSKNPLKESSNRFCSMGGKEFPLCEEWLIAEYTGRTNYPKYQVTIIVNKYSSEEDFSKIEKKWKEIGTKRGFSEEGGEYSRYPFIGSIGTSHLLDIEHKREHMARMNLYWKKRGLEILREK